MSTKIKTTVICPLCSREIPGVVDDLTRTDVLMGHIVTEHVIQLRPATPTEGPPLPRGLNVKWPWRKP